MMQPTSHTEEQGFLSISKLITSGPGESIPDMLENIRGSEKCPVPCR